MVKLSFSASLVAKPSWHVAEISASQKDLLRLCRFVGEPDVSQDEVVNHDGVQLEPSSLPDAGGNSVDPTPIIILSDDDDDGKDNSIPQDDAFYTPPEQSSLLTSSDGFEICKLNQMPDIDDLEDDCEYLGRDYDLGFPVVESESLSLKDDSDESMPKKLKLSVENLSFGNSSGGCFGIEPLNVTPDIAICKGKMVSDTQNPCNFVSHGQSQYMRETSYNARKLLELLVVGENARKLPCSDEGNESTENAVGTSGRKDETDEELFQKLISLIYLFLKCVAKDQGLEIGKGQQEQKSKAVVDDNEKCVEIAESTEGICEAGNLAGTGEMVTEAVERQRITDKQPLCLVSPEKTMESEKGRQEQGSKTGKGAQHEHKASILDALRVSKRIRDRE